MRAAGQRCCAPCARPPLERRCRPMPGRRTRAGALPRLLLLHRCRRHLTAAGSLICFVAVENAAMCWLTAPGTSGLYACSPSWRWASRPPGPPTPPTLRAATSLRLLRWSRNAAPLRFPSPSASRGGHSLAAWTAGRWSQGGQPRAKRHLRWVQGPCVDRRRHAS